MEPLDSPLTPQSLAPPLAPAMLAPVPAPAPAPEITPAPAPMSAQVPEIQSPDNFFERNKAYVLPGDHTYNTDLTPKEELTFREWVRRNKVPFDVNAQTTDYDMRGFWKAYSSGDPRAMSQVDPNDKQLHYSDYWKTPYHETFSAESQWANPKTAPTWNEQDQLVLPDGTILFDDRAANSEQSDKVTNGN